MQKTTERLLMVQLSSIPLVERDICLACFKLLHVNMHLAQNVRQSVNKNILNISRVNESQNHKQLT
jgi:hypothetical protein